MALSSHDFSEYLLDARLQCPSRKHGVNLPLKVES
jgi:hypothetical protein